jgi:hypothetical protein
MVAAISDPDEVDYRFRPEDRPAFPGGTFTPPHPPLRRLCYAAVGLWIGAAATLANAAITVNVSNLAGEHAAYVAELSWLPAVYVAATACSNTLLVKARAQFSMPVVMRALLGVCVVAAAMQFFVANLAAEVILRFVSGVVAGGMTTLGIFYLMQAVPPRGRPMALAAGLGMTQLGTPLARLLPVDLLCAQGWIGLHCIELATGLATLALITWLPLPPSPRSRCFQPLDFVTAALLLPAATLACGVLNRGRLAWWTDTPWLGVDLAVALALLTVAIAIEAGRQCPLIHLSWIGTREFLGFIAIAFLMRIALAEQTYGAVGLLTFGNLDNDQLRELFAWVIVAMVAGIVVGSLTLSERAPPKQVILASLAVAAGAWMDSHANNLTRPEQLYWSQSLIGFGACLFIGPTMVHGFQKVARVGPDHLVTLVVVFSMTQNIGGLAGSALLGSYQTVAARTHFRELADRAPLGDITVDARIAGSTRALADTVVDPGLRAQQGAASLVASMTREANVLAFNDVARIVWRLALGNALLVALLLSISARWPARRAEAA